MKTKEEIINYIRKQNWYEKFEDCRNIYNIVHEIPYKRLEEFNIIQLTRIIAYSFDWDYTEDGYKYWENIQNDLIDFING